MANRTNEGSKLARTDAGAVADIVVPAGRTRFSLRELSELLRVPVRHLYKLAVAGELGVPQEEFERAPTRPQLWVTREALVAFCDRRLTGGNSPKRKKSERDGKTRRRRTVSNAS